MSGIKAVIFDFGNVLAFPPEQAQFAKLARHLELPLDDFLAMFWGHRLEYDRGEEARTYWQRFAVMAGRPLTDALLNDLIRDDVALWCRFDHRVLHWDRSGRHTNAGICERLPP